MIMRYTGFCLQGEQGTTPVSRSDKGDSLHYLAQTKPARASNITQPGTESQNEAPLHWRSTSHFHQKILLHLLWGCGAMVSVAQRLAAHIHQHRFMPSSQVDLLNLRFVPKASHPITNGDMWTDGSPNRSKSVLDFSNYVRIIPRFNIRRTVTTLKASILVNLEEGVVRDKTAPVAHGGIMRTMLPKKTGNLLLPH
ncbi:hypothetical protein BT69DRAFT_1291836 [Atractiella rhizophila]|nr:hypothetical protein BT69DRAFT_1291836 [Atractiella rhizophila]